MNISLNDLVYYRKENNKVLLINKETGRWYVGKDENNILDDILDGKQDAFKSEIYHQLVQQNILYTRPEEIEIEQPYSEILGLVILDTTIMCNLACKYCFVDAPPKGSKMNLYTAIHALEKVLNYNKCAEVLTIEFSGGEPLVNFEMIKDFIPIADNMAKEMGKKLTYTIQTNGTLLTDEIITFLLDHNVNIGISIDGEAEVHDANRIFHDGTGSLSTIIRNIELLQTRGGHVSILAVISSVYQYESVIKFATAHNISDIRTNLVTKAGRAKKGDSFSLEYIAMADKFVEVADRILHGELKIKDATLTFFLWNLLLMQPHMCFRSPCGAGTNQISITATGDIYPCQGWRNIHDSPVGNVNDNTDLNTLLMNNNRVQELRNHIVRTSPSCQDCNWKTFCGVCPREIYSETGSVHGQIGQCIFEGRVFEALMWKFYDCHDEIKRYLSETVN